MRGKIDTGGGKKSDNASLGGIRVLLVDDDPQIRDVLSGLLEVSGATVYAVATVSEALDEFERTLPDILVSDINLDGETGFDLIGELRRPGKTTPALAVTGEPDMQEKILSYGFQACLRKPVGCATLTEAVSALTAARRRTA